MVYVLVVVFVELIFGNGRYVGVVCGDFGCVGFVSGCVGVF